MQRLQHKYVQIIWQNNQSNQQALYFLSVSIFLKNTLFRGFKSFYLNFFILFISHSDSLLISQDLTTLPLQSPSSHSFLFSLTTFIILFICKSLYLFPIQIMNHRKINFSSNRFHHIFNSNEALQIISTEGLSLQRFNQGSRSHSFISLLTSFQFLQSLGPSSHREIQFIGFGPQGLFSSFSFILLTIASNQNKYYPHLLTLIKQQFYKPGVFTDYEFGKRSKIFSIWQNIEIEIISSGSVNNFLQNNEDFLSGFQHVLSKIVNSKLICFNDMIEIIRKKFNIECIRLQIQNSKANCWALGMHKKIYLLQENSYFIVCSLADLNKKGGIGVGQSGVQNKLESQRSVSDFGQQIIIQASEQSTPKFKENQQSIRYRKKSHKNSFGGDFDITGYKELGNLINKSQHEDQERAKPRRVFSLKFELQDSALSNLENSPNGKDLNPDGFQDVGDLGASIQVREMMKGKKMKSSNIEVSQACVFSGKSLIDKKLKRRHIASSEIFELTENRSRFRNLQVNKLQEQKNSNSNSNNTKGEGKLQHNEQMLWEEVNQKVSLDEEQIGFKENESKLEKQKNHFKFSFSKKDSTRFIFREIQSQYNDHQLEPDNVARFNQVNKQDEVYINLKKNTRDTLLRSSLTEFKKNFSNNQPDSPKREMNRRSLFLQGDITPIQEEVQSQKQRTQDQSTPQSQPERDKEQEDGSLNHRQNKVYLYNEGNKNNAFFPGGPGPEGQHKGARNIFNLFKNKNRKFSYLTQPIQLTNNSLFGNNDLRQSFVEQNNQSSENKLTISKISKNKNDRNRISRPPKIHKNSEAVTESVSHKRRFQQNPISFSQLITNHAEDSNFSGHQSQEKNVKRKHQLNLTSCTTQFMKRNSQMYDQPQGWTKKQVMYFFAEEEKKNPQRYIIERVFRKQNKRDPKCSLRTKEQTGQKKGPFDYHNNELTNRVKDRDFSGFEVRSNQHHSSSFQQNQNINFRDSINTSNNKSNFNLLQQKNNQNPYHPVSNLGLDHGFIKNSPKINPEHFSSFNHPNFIVNRAKANDPYVRQRSNVSPKNYIHQKFRNNPENTQPPILYPVKNIQNGAAGTPNQIVYKSQQYLKSNNTHQIYQPITINSHSNTMQKHQFQKVPTQKVPSPVFSNYSIKSNYPLLPHGQRKQYNQPNEINRISSHPIPVSYKSLPQIRPLELMSQFKVEYQTFQRGGYFQGIGTGPVAKKWVS